MGNSQLERERAVYSYLDALDSGDIDGIIASLQQAVYDAPLDQMLDDAHQAYFQGEQTQEDELAEIEAQTTVSMPVVPLKPRKVKRNQKPRQRAPLWLQTLAAVLIVGALIGSFVALLVAHNTGNLGKYPSLVTPTLPACYSLRQFDVQNNVTSAASYNSLSDVTIVSSADAWAVGDMTSFHTTSQTSAPFIEHWDGQSWSMVSSPNITNGELLAVAAVSANDAWAVGRSTPSTGTTPTVTLEGERTLIEHWDGKSWQIVSSPNGPTGNGQLLSLAVVSQHDIWAVGSFVDASQNFRPLLEHWDGTNWQAPEENFSPTIGSLSSVVAISSNDIWAVGLMAITSASGGAQNVGMVLHWNGSQWQHVPAPSDSRELYGITALSARNLWVAGDNQRGRSLVEHWDGQKWDNLAFPGPLANTLAGVENIKAVSANDIWAVGSIEGSQGQSLILILHWDGTSWQQIHTPSLQVPQSESLTGTSGAALDIANGQMWIVGIARLGEGNPISLILGQHTCP